MGDHNSFHLHPEPNDGLGQSGFFTQDIKIHCLIVALNRDGGEGEKSVDYV